VGVIPEALDLPPGSQPWKRDVDSRISALDTKVGRSLQDADNQIMALANTVKTLGEQITAMPIVQILGNKVDGIGVGSTWLPTASFQFAVPAGKKRGRVLVVANAQVLDLSTAKTATAQGRINFGGVRSPIYRAAKDPNAISDPNPPAVPANGSIPASPGGPTSPAVNNVVSANFFYNVNLIPGASYTISFEMFSPDATAFPPQLQNNAALSASITFIA
jgi:hypothetical protein